MFYVGNSILVVGVRGLDALVHVLHLAVDLGDLARALEHLLVDALGQLRLVDLVADIVLKARPEVHRDRAQLDLRPHVFRPVGEVDGNLDIHVQRAITVVVGRLNVVLLFDDLHIRLPCQHLAHAVDVVDVAANDAHARDVVDVRPRGLDRKRQATLDELGDDALLRFDAPVDVVDGISRIEDVELAVEDVEFQRELPDGGVVEILHDEKVVRVLAEGQTVGTSVHLQTSVFRSILTVAPLV